MKLFAISDLHLGHPLNREVLETLPPRPEDWLILAGDVGETNGHLELAFRILRSRFRQLLWVPGNHELWSVRESDQRGEARYRELVALCRRHGVICPEDPYPIWEGEGPRCRLAPLFLLYDYSFAPPEVPATRAVEWAASSGILCADEQLLHSDPYLDKPSWCALRLRETELRLEQASACDPLVLINHFPLRSDLVRLRFIPRFRIWCGSRETENWHKRFRALVVVSGHLHVPATDWRDGVRFEEVSLGYPKQWQRRRFGIAGHLREILPGPSGAPRWFQFPTFHW